MSKRHGQAFNAEMMRTGPGRGRGRSRGRGGSRGGGGGGRGRGLRGAAPARTQPPAPLPPPPTTAQTDTRRRVRTTATDSTSLSADSGSDGDDAPEVLSAKRPPGIEAYESSSSSDVESELPQIAAVADGYNPPRTLVPLKTDPCPSTAGVTATAASPIRPPNTSARPTDLSRRAPPPQPKKPPQNPFAARTSLLRSVSKRILLSPSPFFVLR